MDWTHLAKDSSKLLIHSSAVLFISPTHTLIVMTGKPEVQVLPTVSYCRQRRTEPRPQITFTENLVKVGLAFF